MRIVLVAEFDGQDISVARMAEMGKLKFCEKLVHLQRRRSISTAGPICWNIYNVIDRNLVLRCSRQTEKSTFLVNTILYEACTKPGIQMLFVCPRIEQARCSPTPACCHPWRRARLSAVRCSAAGRGVFKVTNMQFANGSTLFVRAAYHSADACRDQFQPPDGRRVPGHGGRGPAGPPDTLSHAKKGRTVLTGTPKDISNHLETVFSQSTANEWTIPCGKCNRGVILDERSLGPAGIICPNCRSPLNPRDGRWVGVIPMPAGVPGSGSTIRWCLG